MEALRSRGAGPAGRAAVVGRLGEWGLGWVEAQDPSRRWGGRFAERKEAVQER